MAKDKPGRLSRLVRLGGMTAKVTSNYARERVRNSLTGRNVRSRARMHIENASDLVDQMSNMKGVAMKIGQSMAMAAQSLDLPPEVAAKLSKLHKDAEPVPFETIKEDIEASLGMPLHEAYATFDETPIGTASLAQAHRATLHDGTTVVVKVLHRGIEDSVKTDLMALKAILISSRMVRRDRSELDDAFDEIKERLQEELDYLQEAANIHTFAELFADDPRVRVPDVYGSHSTDRVLTMDCLPGVGVEDFVETATPEARQTAGETLADLYYTMAFRYRTLHADPHPGNYLFEPDGRVGILDFGCVKRFDEFWIAGYCRTALAATERDREETLHWCREMGAWVGDDPRAADALWAFCEALTDHLRRGPFTLGGDQDHIVSDIKPSAKGLVKFPEIRVPRNVIFLHRSLGGLYALARRLQPTIDAGALFKKHAEYAVAKAEGRL